MSETPDAKTPPTPAAKKRRAAGPLPPFRETAEIVAELHEWHLKDLLKNAVQSHAAQLIITIDLPDFQGSGNPDSVYGNLLVVQTAHLTAPLPVVTRYRIVEMDPGGDHYTPVRDVDTVREVREALRELRGNLLRGWWLEVYGLDAKGKQVGINLLQWRVRRS